MVAWADAAPLAAPPAVAATACSAMLAGAGCPAGVPAGWRMTAGWDSPLVPVDEPTGAEAGE
ncbi:hypothetical protein [Mycobacterium sp.]|uniref:hypothetical protein n=1 Tax=Mycobacterium sp. TaxID=1785 RepID=UPI0031D7FD89